MSRSTASGTCEESASRWKARIWAASAFLDRPAPRVALDQLFGAVVVLVGEQQRGCFAAEAADRELAEAAFGEGRGHLGDRDVAVLAGTVQAYRLPGVGGQFGDLVHRRAAAAAQGDKADALLVKRGQFGVRGQLEVEDQQAGALAGRGLPELAEAGDLVGVLVLGDVGVGVAERCVLAVLGEEREYRARALAAARDVVLVEDLVLAEAHDCVKVEVKSSRRRPAQRPAGAARALPAAPGCARAWCGRSSWSGALRLGSSVSPQKSPSAWSCTTSATCERRRRS